MAKVVKLKFSFREQCGSCRHFDRLDDVNQMPSEDTLGVCLRYPPTVFGRDENEATLQDVPIVEALHRCGEWQPVLN